MATPDLDALRRQTEGELAELLPRRDPRARVGVLGAGSDDLSSGRAYLERLAPGGYLVPTWPKEHGGMGLSQPEADVVRSVLRRFESPDLYPWMVGIDLIGPTILVHGDDDQQDRWLSRIRSGEEIWCQMFSEPDAGSDLAGLKTKAEMQGDGWLVTGSKVWTSRAHYSQWGLLLARHDPTVPKHAGITAFAVDMSTPGVTVRPLVQSNGDSHFNEVFLDEAVIPDVDRIGAPGEGWRVAITCLAFERGALGGGLGVSQDQLDRLGKAIGDDPVGRDAWARRLADYKIIQWTGLRAKAAREAGKAPGPEDSGTKLRANGLLKPLAALGIATEGPAATIVDGEPDEWQSMFLMSPSLSIRGGTDEIQHNILGERVLGLPPEPRVDKDQPFSET
jgi:alkylation response protein AidB-like acyl-CoA dehydrogenase